MFGLIDQLSPLPLSRVQGRVFEQQGLKECPCSIFKVRTSEEDGCGEAEMSSLLTVLVLVLVPVKTVQIGNLLTRICTVPVFISWEFASLSPFFLSIYLSHVCFCFTSRTVTIRYTWTINHYGRVGFHKHNTSQPSPPPKDFISHSFRSLRLGCRWAKLICPGRSPVCYNL